MPLYEYKCDSCDKEFEVLQKFNEEPLSECLYCHGSVEKLISTSSFQLKGSGWYVTDYKNRTKKPTSPNQDTNTGNLGNKNATIK
jgi:putative FmdB family regulatory protein